MSLLSIISAIKAWQTLAKNLPEPAKIQVDKLIDKLEDLKEDGSVEDILIEGACDLLRTALDIPDYPDADN